MKIAIDTLGGDNAPYAQIDGAIGAINDNNNLEIILVGNQEIIAPYLENKKYNRKLIHIIHTTQYITNNEEPAAAVRSKKNASVVICANLLKSGEADVMLSSGSTGALLAVGLLIVGRIKGVTRPALAPVMPTNKGAMLLLDAGANTNCKPSQLAEFALMGSIYAREVLEIANPRVGLVNIGEEKGKGDDLSKDAYPLLQRAPINFTGNIEARQIPHGDADVVVCDGFVGNVILKLTEGIGEVFLGNLKTIFYSGFFSKISALMVKSGLKAFKQKLDYTEYGGAPLLGCNKPVIKAHGSSNAKAITSAIKKGAAYYERNVTKLIKENMLSIQQVE